MVLPKEIPCFWGIPQINGFFFKTSVNFCQSKDVWMTGDSHYSMAGIRLVMTLCFKMGSFWATKAPKVGINMDKLRLFVWIILTYWIMIIFDPFTLPCQLMSKCNFPKGFLNKFLFFGAWGHFVGNHGMPPRLLQVTDEGRGSVWCEQPVDPVDFLLI